MRIQIIKLNIISTIKISTDRELFKLLLKNIVENALKYDGGKDIEIKTCYKKEKPLIVVEDRGEGMSVEEVEKIFGEFYRGEKSRNKEIGGQG